MNHIFHTILLNANHPEKSVTKPHVVEMKDVFFSFLQNLIFVEWK